VMVNKGDHTVKVIEALGDILHRMGGHHIKKRFTFRQLSIAEKFIKEDPAQQNNKEMSVHGVL
jgi:pyruvate kinase